MGSGAEERVEKKEAIRGSGSCVQSVVPSPYGLMHLTHSIKLAQNVAFVASTSLLDLSI